ncbi:MAG: hypothetical protein Q8L20_10770 [Gammaproteobacteria bacterium]|nr:hypothetical protein [Gammaproteobacteria bacterium]
MKILVTGKGGISGSWRIRGEQLGSAIGARVRPMAALRDCIESDLIVVVKRVPEMLLNTIRRSGKRWVFDMVDCWPQPSLWESDESRAWIRRTLARLRPDAVIFGTPQMQTDSGFLGPSTVLPHHSWQRYVDHPAEIRETISVVGYEGDEGYLGRWRWALDAECARRGWELMINGDMRRADIGIALRHGGGYPARNWKPGTKLSNLHALGLPAVCSVEAGYQSVACGAETFVTAPVDLAGAFDRLTSFQVRTEIAREMRAAQLTLSDVARTYKNWMEAL